MAGVEFQDAAAAPRDPAAPLTDNSAHPRQRPALLGRLRRGLPSRRTVVLSLTFLAPDCSRTHGKKPDVRPMNQWARIAG